MTDLEKFIDTYKQFGIDVKAYRNTNGNTQIVLNSKVFAFSTLSDKFNFPLRSFSDLEFTKDGKFIRQGFWEE